MLRPLPGYALVRLKEKYESGLSTEKEKYAERSEGELVAVGWVAGDPYDSHIAAEGKTVYFAPYTEGEPVKHDGHEYVYLPIKELRGVKENA